MLDWYYTVAALFAGALFGLAVTAVCVSARSNEPTGYTDHAAWAWRWKRAAKRHRRLAESWKGVAVDSFKRSEENRLTRENERLRALLEALPEACFEDIEKCS